MQTRRLLAAEAPAAVAALATVGAVNGLAVPVLNHLDQIGIDPAAAVDEGGVGGRDAIGRRLPCPQRHGQVRRHVVDHPHALGQIDHILHAHGLGQTHGHDVARQLQPAAQALRSIILTAVVLGRPAAAVGPAGEADRRVQHDRGRREVAFQRRRIDEGLVGRARLTTRLGRAVEAGQGVGITADHRQNAARLRLDGHQGAVHGGDLLQRILAATRLDEDQIAALQRTVGVGPGGVRDDQRTGAIIASRADADVVAADAFDGGRLPGATLGRGVLLQRVSLPALGEVGRAPSAAPAVAAVIAFQPVHQGVAGGGLQLGVQRRPHVIAAAVDLFLTEQADGAAAGFLDEEVGVGVFGPARRRARVQRTSQSRRQLFLRQPLVVGHLAQHPVPTPLGGFGMALRIVVVRTLGQGRQEGRFVRRQLVQRLAEVVVGG
ncbi:hypothetical protein D3C72_1069360 [compost metagenome]